MKADNLRKLADVIEFNQLPGIGFNMEHTKDSTGFGAIDYSGQGCGTVFCIAGYASKLSEPTLEPDYILGRLWLDLDYEDAAALFAPYGYAREPYTPTMAAATLRYAAEHNVIDWTCGGTQEAFVEPAEYEDEDLEADL